MRIALFHRRAAFFKLQTSQREHTRKTLHLIRAQRQPVIRHRAGEGRAALDAVQTIHRICTIDHAALDGELAAISQAPGKIDEKIGIERQNDVGLIETVLRLDIIAEGQPAAFARIVAIGRLVLMPLRGGKR
ncbi:MAG: hypothetical protein ALAOOOJD_04214 [bacterium]|nr:hypothetical protein [bacterium]